jgi:RNA polymerase sigma factor (sigma-70 family)
MDKGHVYLVDDNADIRWHLTGLLKQFGFAVDDMESAQAFIGIKKLVRPAVLVVDMRMPELSGLDLQTHLHNQSIFIPVIFISGESQQQEIINAMKAGAIEFLWKPFESAHLIAAIERGLLLDTAHLKTQSRTHALHQLEAALSPREHEIFIYMLQGKSNKEIAEELGINADTVKKHRAQVMAKMKVTTLHDLLSLWDKVTPSLPSKFNGVGGAHGVQRK